ncbi:S-syntaxin [Fasciola hepatica]|uniref:S-syntaxin n=1 Tax=Fasciola hepatica TaxID=6192 RepID=A0A4E0R5H0_FASHE|nr:S-syntaxin [Fasciola hepatica]
MTKDLLQTLRDTNQLPQDVEAYGAPAPYEQPDGDEGIDEFFAEVEWIRERVDHIQGLVTQVRTKHSEILSAPQQNERTKQELEELTNSIKLLAGQVRTKIKQLEHTITQQEAADPGSATVRLRRTQWVSRSLKFTNLMKQYATIQCDFRERCKLQLKRRLEVAERPVTDEELDEMLKSDNPQIFTQGILMDTQQARQNVADIEARHEDIMKLEQSIRELYDLFNDLANLVETQGELIDRIEYNVANTKDHVESAKIAVTQAVVYKKKTRKKKIIIISVVTAVVVLLIIILIASLVPKR